MSYNTSLDLFQAVCLKNQRSSASFLRPQRSSSPPTHSASGGSAMAGEGTVCRLFAFLLFLDMIIRVLKWTMTAHKIKLIRSQCSYLCF